MKPSPCRFVLYHFLDYRGTREAPKLTSRPALVTSIDDDGKDGMTVNLHVFFEPLDAEVSPRYGHILNDPGTARMGCDPALDPEKPEPQTWTWPPRV